MRRIGNMRSADRPRSGPQPIAGATLSCMLPINNMAQLHSNLSREPYGDAEPEELYDSFRQQIGWLVEAGADLVCIETMVDLAEATLAIRAAKEVSPPTPVMATMTFDPTPKGFFTIMGVDVEHAAEGLRAAGADVVGSNCGNGIENMITIAREFRKYTELPRIIQSNAGLPKTTGDKLEYEETPAFMAEKARALVDAGVSIIGGCCGTTPEHTNAVRRMLDSWDGP